MTVIIPVTKTTDAFMQQVALDGVVYDLTFYWNPRGNHWFIDIGRDSVTLIRGVKLVNSSDLLQQFSRIEGLPSGVLQVVDLDGLDRDPDASNFGDRVQLRYV